MGEHQVGDQGAVSRQLDDLAVRLHAEGEKVAQLSQAVETRDVIGQAKGILMERHKLSDEEAFAFLQRISNGTNCKLHDVAAHLARTGIIEEP